MGDTAAGEVTSFPSSILSTGSELWLAPLLRMCGIVRKLSCSVWKEGFLVGQFVCRWGLFGLFLTANWCTFIYPGRPSRSNEALFFACYVSFILLRYSLSLSLFRLFSFCSSFLNKFINSLIRHIYSLKTIIIYNKTNNDIFVYSSS